MRIQVLRDKVLRDKLMVGRAAAVEAGLAHEFTARAPATVLRRHPNTAVYLHNASSSRLSREPLAPFDAILPA